VVLFDTTGSGASLAAHFRVGEVVLTGVLEGGGILQNLYFAAAGNYTVSLDFAANDPSTTFGNLNGGRIQLLVDGVVQRTFDAGPINPGQTIGKHLDTPVSLTSGIHEFRFQITRPATSTDNTAAEQYLDNLHIDGGTSVTSSVPAPPALVLVGLGAGCVALRRYVGGRATA
jgi:hypothetical protein